MEGGQRGLFLDALWEGGDQTLPTASNVGSTVSDIKNLGNSIYI